MRKERDTFTTSEMEARLVQKPTRRSFKDLEGWMVGKLTVHGWAGITGNANFWWCSCSCGEKYFKVRSDSLQKGVTTSCGCAYENNGATLPKDNDWFQEKLPHFTVTSDYKGFNHPVKITCKYCGVVYDLDKAMNAVQRSCTCNRATAIKRAEVFKSLGYTLMDEAVIISGTTYLYSVQCDTCKLESRSPVSRAKRCPCHLGIEEPCSVYILTSATKPYVKIGKSLDPESRVQGINKSGAEDFEIAHLEWVSGEKCAYLLENHLHSTYGGRNLDDRPGYSGDTEIFHTTLEEVLAYLKSIERSLKHLRKGITPPGWEKSKKLPNVPVWSFEFDGHWYPNLKYFWQQYGYPDRLYTTEFLLENFTTHQEVYEWVHKGLHTQFGISYDEYQARLRASGISTETVRSRVQSGWTFEVALDTPLQRIRKVYYNGELLTVKAFFEQFGLKSTVCTEYRREYCGDIPFVEAMVKTLRHFNVNHITESDITPYCIGCVAL